MSEIREYVAPDIIPGVVVEVTKTVQRDFEEGADWTTLRVSETIDRLSIEQSKIDWASAPGVQLWAWSRRIGTWIWGELQPIVVWVYR